MKYRITLPTNEKLDLHNSCISKSFIKGETFYTFFYKNRTPFGWITQNAIGKIIDAEPINASERTIEGEECWFLRCEDNTNGEFPNVINKIFLKKIDNNLLKNE